MNNFSWLPFFTEMLAVVCEKYNKQTLCEVFHEVFTESIGTQDRFPDGTRGPLQEIDPLTFIGFFNKQIKEDRRVAYCKTVKQLLGLNSDAPSDFDAIPRINNKSSWFFGYAKDRNNHDIDNLWEFGTALNDIAITNELFAKVLKIKNVGIPKLTQLMFICKPQAYISLNSPNMKYFEKKGIEIPIKQFKESANGFDMYMSFLGEVQKHFADKAFYEISKDAYSDREDIVPDDNGNKYWVIAPGRNAEIWDDFKKNSIIAIGWDKLGDLNKYGSKEEIQESLQQLYGSETSPKNKSLACYEFAHVIQPGDFVFAKKGTSSIIGYGEILSGYTYDDTRPNFKHTRKVEWLSEGDWRLPKDSKLVLKTLTKCKKRSDFVKSMLARINQDGVKETKYWWLNANPKIWNFADVEIGGKQRYTSHNEKGNKRRIFKHFEDVKKGDIVLGYVASPDREIVSICKISQGLQDTDEGMAIEFEKVEELNVPVPLKELQAQPKLAQCEPLINNQGSLFKVTAEEYEIIRDLIDEKNPPRPDVVEKYTVSDAARDLFLSEKTFSDILLAIAHKKNIILQGAPGVGKTFIAKRLAYALVGAEDKQKVQMIQFHQSYSYEDFIQGYRPTDQGTFELKNGIFYEFCKRAQRDKASKYVFIIDEINRGNLSKIFGELMMLIEADKRGTEYAVPLTYAQTGDETFFIPANMYLIGTMNTADRSLAMVDYALRRRFSFIDLEPCFNLRFRSHLKGLGVGQEVIGKIIERMTHLNKQISSDLKNLGEGFRIGHSFFCPDGQKQEYGDEWYELVIKHEIEPLIREYWFDDIDKAEASINNLLK